jgi:hypothetical protein
MLDVCIFRVCGEVGLTLLCHFLLFNLLRDKSLWRRRALQIFSFFFFFCVAQFKCMLFCMSE